MKSYMGIILLGLFMVSGCAVTNSSQQIQAPNNQDIKSYLKENPDIVLDILRENKKEFFDIVIAANKAHQNDVQKQNVLAYFDNPISPDLDPQRPFLGNPKAPYTLVAFSDFQCPACSNGAKTISRLMAKHPETIKLYLRHLPSDDLSKKLSLYFEAISRQSPEKAWEFYKKAIDQHDEIAEKKMSWINDTVKALNIDQSKLALDMADESLALRLQRDSDEADVFQFETTPTYILNGVAIEGAAPMKVFEDIMELWEKHQQKK